MTLTPAAAMPRLRRTMPETVGQRVKRLRTARALSQPELAALVRVDHATLSRWETDRRRPRSPAIRRALADALGVSVSVLMTGAEAPIDHRAASGPPVGHDRRRAVLAPLRVVVEQVQRLGDEALAEFVDTVVGIGERTVKRYR
jgi:transcriptional regulator with XRE-family HTH domain